METEAAQLHRKTKIIPAIKSRDRRKSWKTMKARKNKPAILEHRMQHGKNI